MINEILSALAPALILLIVALVTKYFPPSLGNSFLIKTPDWWSRDQQTWKDAYCYLVKVYAVLGLVLTAICGLLYIVGWVYSSYLSFALLFVFLALAHLRTRTYMRENRQ